MIKYKLINKDRTGNITTKQDSIYYLAFVKELSFAGINSNSPTLETYCRLLTNFFEFIPSFIHSRFHLHPDLENDPTERNQFSNKVGRTFAVYLAKKISGAKYVYNYECALKKKGFPIYAKPFVQTLFSKNNELSSNRFCLQSVCYQTCFVNFIRSFVAQPLMNPFTIEELYKFPETFSQFLCA